MKKGMIGKSTPKTFVSLIKFLFPAKFTENNLSHPVMYSLQLLLYQFAVFSHVTNGL